MSGTPLATAFVRVLPDTAGFGPALRSEAAAATPTIVPHVNTAEAEGKIKGFINDVGGKLIGAFAIAEVLKSGVEAQESYQKGLAQLQAGLKSTGGVAGLTAEEMEKLADKISNYSGQNRNTIVSTEQLLLAFHNIRDEAGKGNDVFTRTTQIAADMAARLGGDASSQAIKLGKALEDPIHGTSTLTRVGVQFTVAQKELIKSLVESGDTLGAQKVILDALDEKFAGSAKAVGSTLTGEIHKAKNAFEELSGEIVSAAAPALDVIIKGAVGVGKAFFAGVTFLKDHKDAVLLVVGAYAALKWESIAGAIVSFATRSGAALAGLATKALGGEAALRALGSGNLIVGGIFSAGAFAAVAAGALVLDNWINSAHRAEDAIGKIRAENSSDPFDFAGQKKLVEDFTNALDAAENHNSSFFSRLQGEFSGSTFIDQSLIGKLPDQIALINREQYAGISIIDQLSKAYGLTNDQIVTYLKMAKLNPFQDPATENQTFWQDKLNDSFAKYLGLAPGYTAAQQEAAGATVAVAAANTQFNTAVGVVGKSLGGQIDLLAGVANQSKLTGAQLLQQASSSLIAIAQETTNIQQLQQKGLDPAAIKALVSKGPEYIQAANSLSVTDLKKFGTIYGTENKAQWDRNVAVVKLGADGQSRAAIASWLGSRARVVDALDKAFTKPVTDTTQGLIDAGVAAGVNTPRELADFLIANTPKVTDAAKSLYSQVQPEIDKLHGKELQVILDDLASGNISKLMGDLQALQQQMQSLQQTNVLGVPGAQLLATRAARGQAAGGAKVPGFDPMSTDSELYALSKGEWVIQNKAAAHYGDSVMAAINAGTAIVIPRAAGGPTDAGQLWRQPMNDGPLIPRMDGFDGYVQNGISQIGALAAGLAAKASGNLGGSVSSPANEALANAMMAQHGWNARQIAEVDAIWTQESGFNANAVNPDGGAYGIPQAYPPAWGHPYALGDASGQIAWGINYIDGIGGPDAAYARKVATGTYDRGGFLAPGWNMAYNGTGKPERVPDPTQPAQSAPLVHIEHWHGDQTDAYGLASMIGAQARASMISRRV